MAKEAKDKLNDKASRVKAISKKLDGKRSTPLLAARRKETGPDGQPIGPITTDPMEIDRIAQSWAAHESDMHKLEREDQLALTRVRAEFIKGMPERITASLNPIRAEMLLLAERIDRQPRLDAIDERQRDHSELLRENTAAIRSLERQPRTSVSYIIWDRELSGRKVCAALAVICMLSVSSYPLHRLNLHSLRLLLPTPTLKSHSIRILLPTPTRKYAFFCLLLPTRALNSLKSASSA